MDILRYRSDAWGQRILDGVSWDLLWVFVAAGLAFIVCHAIYTHRKLKPPTNLEPRKNDE